MYSNSWKTGEFLMQIFGESGMIDRQQKNMPLPSGGVWMDKGSLINNRDGTYHI